MDKFYEIEYTGRIKRTGDIFNTTDEEKAKEEGIHSEKSDYGPKLITNENEVIEGIIEAVKNMGTGEERELTLPPKKAYGERDSSKIETIPKSEFKDTKLKNPAPGMQVMINNKIARIQTVSGGRVRIDFNNPLAGKELDYELKLNKVIENDEERSKALLSKLTSTDKEEIDIEEEEDAVKFTLPKEAIKGENKEQVIEVLEKRVEEETEYEEVNVETNEGEE